MSEAQTYAHQLVIWPVSPVPNRILFHSDFDGICSAAILRHFFAHDHVILESVDYSSDRSQWLGRRLERAAVVDFLYHPEALWWFDHHSTAFMKNHHRSFYQPDARHRWDPSYPSCPPLILDVLEESEDVSPLREEFEEWVHWCNVIDAARYESPHQATKGDEPCLLINQALSESKHTDLRRHLVVEISRGVTPDQLSQETEIQSLWRAHRSKVDGALAVVEERIRRIGPVALCDITGRRALFLRYGVYCFQPNVRYSVTAYDLHKGSRPYKVSLSFNPWLDAGNNSVDLGKLAREYGGGGRETVGSIAFESSQECSRVAEEVAKRLDRETDDPDSAAENCPLPAAVAAS